MERGPKQVRHPWTTRIATFFDGHALFGAMRHLRNALRGLPPDTYADLLESDDSYLLVIDVPGATAESTDVRARNGLLLVEARREKDVPDAFRYRREDRRSFIDIEVPLPPDAVPSEAAARTERGVLEVTVPKRWSTGVRSIPVEER